MEDLIRRLNLQYFIGGQISNTTFRDFHDTRIKILLYASQTTSPMCKSRIMNKMIKIIGKCLYLPWRTSFQRRFFTYEIYKKLHTARKLYLHGLSDHALT